MPVRAVLYTLTNNTGALVAIQILDSAAAGIFGVVPGRVIADLTHGTGRFNLTLGAIGTAVGIGASLSQVIAGSGRSWKAIMVSWAIALLEYRLAAPANRLGYGEFSGFQLRIIQEVVTLVVLTGFAILFLKEKLAWNYLVAFVFLAWLRSLLSRSRRLGGPSERPGGRRVG